MTIEEETKEPCERCEDQEYSDALGTIELLEKHIEGCVFIGGLPEVLQKYVKEVVEICGRKE